MTVNINVGRQRISSKLDATTADFTMAVKREFRRLTAEVNNMMDAFAGDVSVDVMLQALAPTFEQSQVYCPVKTGDLKASGYLLPNGSPKAPRVEMGYGHGGEPNYAVFVHEMVDLKHEAPTQAKFLQKALVEDMEFIFLRLVKHYQDAFNGH